MRQQVTAGGGHWDIEPYCAFRKVISMSAKYLVSILVSAALIASCSHGKKKEALNKQDDSQRKPAQISNSYEIPWDVKKGEIKENCPKQLAEFESNIEEWLKKSQADKNPTSFDLFLDYENINREFEDQIAVVFLIFNLHTDKDIRQEAHECKILVGNTTDRVSARTDVYQALKKLKPRNKAESRLSYVTLKGLEQSGALIADPAKHAEFLKIQQKLNELSNQFSKNINDDKTVVEYTLEELDGVPENSIKRFEKSSAGKYIVTMKASDYVDVIANANSEETRKRMYVAYRKRVGPKNIEILKEVLANRQKVAELMGYKNWAGVTTGNRMAKSPENVFKFYDGLRPQFFAMRDKNMARLKKFIPEANPELKGKPLNAWDLEYYSRLYKKKYKDYDPEKAREYFPRQKVVSEMLKFYQEMFNVQFKEVANTNVWHSSVKTYEIIDGGKTIAYFYLDLEPRDGKYNHQAAMGYRSTFKMVDGSNRRPIGVMMANFTPEKPDAPSLLGVQEVETLFHEFGHIMHQTLTKTPYASLSGTNVYRDFVEAPSQMLENWVYTDQLLDRMTSHYKTGERIPKDLVKKFKADKNYNSGIFHSRQMMLGMYDMSLHTKQGLDPLEFYFKLAKDYSGFEPVPEDVFPAQFGHLMGYSAGYYGYLWSVVFAEDMFSKFKEQGVMNKDLGMKYRRVILQQGNMKEPMDLLRQFLGREPSQKAFIESIQEK